MAWWWLVGVWDCVCGVLWTRLFDIIKVEETNEQKHSQRNTIVRRVVGLRLLTLNQFSFAPFLFPFCQSCSLVHSWPFVCHSCLWEIINWKFFRSKLVWFDRLVKIRKLINCKHNYTHKNDKIGCNSFTWSVLYVPSPEQWIAVRLRYYVTANTFRWCWCSTTKIAIRNHTFIHIVSCSLCVCVCT